MRGLVGLFCFLLCMQTGVSQTYPRWFMEQGTLGCSVTAVGYAAKGFYNDSSVAQAVRNAHRNLAMQRRAIVQGGQAFWTTEAGTAWMGSDLKISVDSSALQRASPDTSKADVFFASDFAMALATDGTCGVADSMKTPVKMSLEEPSWVHMMPRDARQIFSVGVAPRYYYEASSWKAAERMALVGLAREAGDSLAAIEKSAGRSGQEVLNEQVSVVLREYEVRARWYDRTNGVFYVLMSIDRSGVEAHSFHDAAGTR